MKKILLILGILLFVSSCDTDTERLYKFTKTYNDINSEKYVNYLLERTKATYVNKKKVTIESTFRMHSDNVFHEEYFKKIMEDYANQIVLLYPDVYTLVNENVVFDIILKDVSGVKIAESKLDKEYLNNQQLDKGILSTEEVNAVFEKFHKFLPRTINNKEGIKLDRLDLQNDTLFFQYQVPDKLALYIGIYDSSTFLKLLVDDIFALTLINNKRLQINKLKIELLDMSHEKILKEEYFTVEELHEKILKKHELVANLVKKSKKFKS